MIYPLTLFATMFGFKQCPHCGKMQAIRKEQRRPVCKKCGRPMTVQLRKGGAV